MNARRSVGLIFVFAMLVLLAANISAEEKPGAKIQDAVVFIHSIKMPDDDPTRAEHRYGSGFVISPLGHLITANHVIFSDEPGFVTSTTGAFSSRSNRAYPLNKVDSNQNLDIALLVFPSTIDHVFSPVQFGDSRKVNVGDRLLAWGFPEGLDLTLSDGILSATGVRKGYWQTTIGINRGQSGGPIFNANNEVVAIAIAGEDSMTRVTYAIPEAYSTNLRQIAMSSPPPPDLRLPISTGDFLYVASIGAGSENAPTQRFCLPVGYEVSAAVHSDLNTAQGELQLSRTPESPNCVDAVLARSSESEAAPVFLSARVELLGQRPGPTSELAEHNVLREPSGGVSGSFDRFPAAHQSADSSPEEEGEEEFYSIPPQGDPPVPVELPPDEH